MSSKYIHSFTPMTIRGVYYKNRLELAPPGCAGTADERGFVTPKFVAAFRPFARGGAAVINVGNVSIDITESCDEGGQLDMRSDECVGPLSSFADMCSTYGAHGQLELNHCGATMGNFNPSEPVPYRFAPSPVITAAELICAKKQHRDPAPTTEMSPAKIEETVKKYADAAKRVKRAGLKTVMLHGAHGNLLAQFFSPYFNRRTDAYGGSIHNRARFAVEVLDAVRQNVGEDFVIEYRISAEEFHNGHTHFNETMQFIEIIRDKVDILHVSGGLHDTLGEPQVMKTMFQPYTFPQMFNVHWAADIKKVFPDLIVATVGSIKNIDQAEEIIASGKADFVAFMRALLADPEMPRKYASGHEEDHRPCLRCQCVRIRNGVFHGPCAVNPILRRTDQFPEGRVPPAFVKKKVAVVGGGPAGVQAMLTLLDRGHDVTLYEKTGRIGGNVVNAALAPFKVDVKEYLDYLVRQCEKSPARVLMNTEATPELLSKENYDAVIVAIGAKPLLPDVPGIDKPHVHWAPDAEAGRVPVGSRIVVVGAGTVGMECAVHLAREGRKVTMIRGRASDPLMSDKVEVRLASGESDLIDWLGELKVPRLMDSKLLRVEDKYVVFTDTKIGGEIRLEADTVLLASGMLPRFQEGQSFRHSAPETDVYLVGDCAEVGDIRDAVGSAFTLASQL